MVMSLLTRPKKTVATVIIAADGSGNFNTDGTADEVEFNAAMDSLPAGGGVVYVREGTYNIDASIVIPDDNIEIIGAGASTRIETTQNIAMITATNVDRISIHLIYLYGAGAGGANYGIYFDTVTLSLIDGCWIENVGFTGISLISSSNQNTIHNCKVTNNVGVGFYAFESSYNNLINNQCNNNSTFGIGLGSEANYNIIKGNITLSNNLYGIYLQNNANNNIVSGNQVIRNIGDGIYIESDDNIISSNECIDNDFNNTGTYDGIILDHADRNVISNNRCRGNDDWGINLTGSFSNENLIMGNTCMGNTTGAIQDNGTDTQIFNNIEI